MLLSSTAASVGAYAIGAVAISKRDNWVDPSNVTHIESRGELNSRSRKGNNPLDPSTSRWLANWQDRQGGQKAPAGAPHLHGLHDCSTPSRQTSMIQSQYHRRNGRSIKAPTLLNCDWFRR